MKNEELYILFLPEDKTNPEALKAVPGFVWGEVRV
jgi:hypothetical protein